ncbi:Glutaredoxin [Cribrihabitans marinus]|uniref:Methylamine utilization protein MauE n=1 Tax=Cribrihabitans marinus TaxID=1227549 RepID=A0A1H7CWL8_9RHOB|nr:MauE/DoxX family redox-associated membrane protein [Cribrihabitans marinus]GGH36787.1 membrane protein [Cribrihabitans marinus]SEJ93979.1 Glutaredoxin [Cribrihabitans marinus]
MTDIRANTSNADARLYRMEMPEHHCPFGLKSKALLRWSGYKVEDHPLTTREETDRFMNEVGVDTTPQTYVGGERIGGYEELRAYLGMPLRGEGETTYTPVIALFAMALGLAVSAGSVAFGTLADPRVFQWFIAISMCLLALQKLRDVESFSTMFLNYDLLARRFVPYGYFYPFAEGLAGLLMLAGVLTWIAAPLALLVGTVGAVSVFKAVYIDKRELKCACMGGSSDVPLGFVSLTENLMMAGMGIWMLAG